MPETRTDDVDCSICIGETQFGLKTNCGHVYCGNCILEVYRHSNGLSPMLCPYCRQKVTTLVPCFNEDERNNRAEILTGARILQLTWQYNRSFSEELAELEARGRILDGRFNPSTQRFILIHLIWFSLNFLLSDNMFFNYVLIIVIMYLVFLLYISHHYQ